MNPTTAGLLFVLAAYFVGTIPFGLLVARIVAGIDIRQHGSGNIGATNVGRVLGSKWGAVVLVLDLLKGALPLALLPETFAPHLGTQTTHWTVAAGLAAIAGHMFPCWLGFRGGKGVATAAGVVLCLAPQPALVAVVTFIVVTAMTRYISLASIVGAIAFAVCEMVLLRPKPFRESTWSLAAFSLLVPALIVFRQRANIGRLWRGEEPKYQFRKKAATNPDASSTNSHST